MYYLVKYNKFDCEILDICDNKNHIYKMLNRHCAIHNLIQIDNESDIYQEHVEHYLIPVNDCSYKVVSAYYVSDGYIFTGYREVKDEYYLHVCYYNEENDLIQYLVNEEIESRMNV